MAQSDFKDFMEEGREDVFLCFIFKLTSMTAPRIGRVHA